MTVSLSQNAANQTTVEIGELSLEFSYRTIVAFRSPATGLVVSENQWSVTTGKHLNQIDGGRKDTRLSADAFARSLAAVLTRYGLATQEAVA